jgi:hypothetical protein
MGPTGGTGGSERAELSREALHDCTTPDTLHDGTTARCPPAELGSASRATCRRAIVPRRPRLLRSRPPLQRAVQAASVPNPHRPRRLSGPGGRAGAQEAGVQGPTGRAGWGPPDRVSPVVYYAGCRAQLRALALRAPRRHAHGSHRCGGVGSAGLPGAHARGTGQCDRGLPHAPASPPLTHQRRREKFRAVSLALTRSEC